MAIEISGREGEAIDGRKLTATLADVGWVAEVRSPPARRAGGEVADMVMHLFEAVESHVLDAAVGAVVGVLTARGRSTRRKRAVVEVLGPDGRVIKRVEVPAGDSDSRTDV